MGYPFENHNAQGWWQHPAHKRKCNLARENILEVAKARGLSRIRRKAMLSKAWNVVFYGACASISILLGWELVSLILSLSRP